MKLNQLEVGGCGLIKEVGGEGALRQHFLDMGVIPGARVCVEKLAPMGDPMELRIHGYQLTLRIDDAAKIEISRSDNGDESISKPSRKEILHPGLGEGGKYHEKENAVPLPDDEILSFALVGQQNTGKTTLFNQLTGANQHVGNFPGVTVDRKDGPIRGKPNTVVTDLPGIYSMSPYSPEEIVSRRFVLEEKPKAIINIVDATNIERNLYLTMQLLEMNVPMVVALNMMDEVIGNGGSININEIEARLGVPVVPISASKNKGIEELITHAIHVAHYQEKPILQDYCDSEGKEGAIHRCIHSVSHLIEDHAKDNGLPVRFSACKLIEGDALIRKQLKLDTNEEEAVEHLVVQMETEYGLDRAAAIADMRFGFIKKVCDETVTRPRESKERIISKKIDRILTGKYTAIPSFILIIAAIFVLTFNVIGAWLQHLLELGIDFISKATDAWLTSVGANRVIHSLIIDGLFAGVGSVLSFLPIIVTLFLFLSLLEDSGYMARIAFVMDKLLRKLGLSGRSIVPLLVGFGCTVPAVMSTRTLPSERDRKMTVLLTPFMSCPAKIPIYSFFIAAFFPGKGGLIMTGLYLLGILMAILTALLFKKTLFKGEAVPFVMEMPNYRLPSLKNVSRLIWEKAKDFLKKAFTVILIATIVVWFLQSFDIKLNMVDKPELSILAVIAGIIAPVFAPLKLNDWRICTSLISGFIAKESVVSTMEILFGSTIGSALTPLSAASMLAFSLLYTPCIAAIASIRRELGFKWSSAVVIWQCLIAWVVAFIVKLICGAFGMV